MTRGRKPKPTHLKLVTGNPGRRPLNEREPNVPRAIPTPPEHLSELALAEWERITPDLYNAGCLARIDRAAIAAYCQAYARWVHAEQQLAKYGMMVKSPQKVITKRAKNGSVVEEKSGGFPMQSPFLAIANRAIDQMVKIAAEFGMTPSSRSRIEVGGQEDAADPAREFLA